MADSELQNYRILLAVEEKGELTENEKDEIKRLLKVGLFLTLSQKAEKLLVLGLVQVGEGQSLSTGVGSAQNQRALINELIESAQTESGLKVPNVTGLVRVCKQSELAQELNDVLLDERVDLLLLGSEWFEGDIRDSHIESPLEDVIRRPLCDLAVISPNVHLEDSREILLAARGGPFVDLALRLTGGIVQYNEGKVTLLHVTQDKDFDGLPDEGFDDSPFTELANRIVGQRWLRRKQLFAPNVQEAILQEAGKHQLVLLGATASNFSVSRTEALMHNPIGPLARELIAGGETQRPGVIVVKAGAARDNYFARLQRRKQLSQARLTNDNYISDLVDKWFAENTFNADEFEDVERLIALKKAQGVTLSLGLPALNEEATVGDVISVIKKNLYDKYPLLDEIVLIDSSSEDRTREIGKELGIPVHIHQEVLPSQGARRGKGEALWKSLYVLKGDIIAWVDTDVTNMHPRFIYGLVGPLLKEQRLQYIKGYYRRPLQVGDKVHETGGGRVTELTVRPLFNLFFPELSGFIQPLSGEYAGRRNALEQLPFFTGYGVETGHLIDLLELFGLQSIGQVNLHERRHRNQELGKLSQMAFAITQVIINRLEQRERLHLTDEMNRNMKLIERGEQGLHLNVRKIEDRERPPMLEVPEYRQLHRKRLIHLAK
jgi:glucosyl-3-phosphoglycerate synthase